MWHFHIMKKYPQLHVAGLMLCTMAPRGFPGYPLLLRMQGHLFSSMCMAKAVCNQGQTKSLLEQLRPFPKTHAALKRFEDEYPQLFQHLIYDCKRFVYRSPYAMIPLVQATFKMRSTEVAKWLVAVDAPVIVASAQDDDMVPCVLQQ